ncbi:MAG: hypothetical protein ACP5JW_06705 [Candidatus Bathyarchaeia archaeon]
MKAVHHFGGKPYKKAESCFIRDERIMASLERVKLIERLLSEANGYLEKGDAV